VRVLVPDSEEIYSEFKLTIDTTLSVFYLYISLDTTSQCVVPVPSSIEPKVLRARPGEDCIVICFPNKFWVPMGGRNA
jgi:hypothetical protein